MKTLTIELKAGEAQDLHIAGVYFEVLKTMSAITVNFESGLAQQVDAMEDVTEGVYVNQAFIGCRIVSPVDQVVKVLYGRTSGGNRAAPLTGTVNIGNVPTVNVGNARGAFTHVDPPVVVTNAVGGVQLLPDNAARRLLIIQNNSTVGVLWVRLDGGVPAVGKGIKLEAGESINLEAYAPTGAVRAIGDIANNPDVSVTEG